MQDGLTVPRPRAWRHDRMVRAISRGWCPLATAVLLFVGALASPAAGPDSWKFDILRLKTGGIMTGIVVDEDDDSIKFQVVKQQPGQKTYVGTTTKVQREEIARLEKLNERDRDLLRKK